MPTATSRVFMNGNSQAVRLKTAGTPIGASGRWIASHALAERATRVTTDTRTFACVTGLLIDNRVDPAGA